MSTYGDRALAGALVISALLAGWSVVDAWVYDAIGVWVDVQHSNLMDLVLIMSAAGIAASAMIVMVRRATIARIEAEEAVRDLAVHVAAGRALQEASDPNHVLSAVCEAIVARGAVRAWVGVPDRAGIRIIAFAGSPEPPSETGPQADRTFGVILQRRTAEGAVRLADPPGNPSNSAPPEPRWQAVVPLLVDGTAIGALSTCWPGRGPLRTGTRETLERVAGDLARGHVSMRRQAELATTNARLQTMLDSFPLATILFGPDRRVAYANGTAATAFGCSVADLAGLVVDELVPAAAARNHAQHVDRYYRAPWVRHPGDKDGLHARRRDGSTFPADVALAPIEIDGGMHVVCTVVDLSSRLAMEARLMQAEKMEAMGQLAGILAHDFRNYLGAIRGYASLALEDMPEHLAASHDVAAIDAVVADASSLIGNVLAMAKPPATDGDARCAVAGAITDALPIIRRAVAPNVGVEVALAEGLPEIAIGPAQLSQVLLNLATNARNAMPAGGSLRITSRATQNGLVEIGVQDSGMGMTHDVAARLFEPFFTTGGPGTGTGLGLTSVKLIVDRAGGSIGVESTPGGGSTFRMLLPVAGPKTGAA